MKLRSQILVFLLVFGLTPLLLSVGINLPLVLERTGLFYHKAYLQNLRADFRDLDQHLASRHEMIRLLAKLPEPGLILGEQGEEDQIDLARARYTAWINQILSDQRDIVQILFLDDEGHERFWLERDEKTLAWRPTAEPPERPNEQFIAAGLRMQPGGVMVSRIRIDPFAGTQDPRQLMTLSLISAIGSAARAETLGLVAMTIDVGGLAQFYRDTLWVNNNGSYLRPGRPIGEEPEAFNDFPGLARIFAEGQLALWRNERGEQILWVPMFLTEDAVPLWVARQVDPSPLAEFRNAIVVRVASIVLALIVVVMILARSIAARAERFGQELTNGIGRVLRDGEGMRFAWRGPREIRDLGEQLSALAQTHVEHLRVAQEHTEELERSNRYKSEFLANVSHELRTPLNSILLLSKMLADQQSGVTPQQRRQAQVIHEAGRDLHAMIDNILDISRIEAGQVAVNLEWVALPPLAEELIELVAPQLSAKGLALHLEVSADAPARIYSDREKLRQILKNFLANAVKFTEHGGVTLEVARGPDADLPVALAVTDTGIGIPEDKQELIFEAFRQADGSTRRRYGGTGLGLSISRELATLLGGRIHVESSEGQGARFTLLLPIALDPSHIAADQVTHEPPLAPEPAVPLPRRSHPAYPGHWVLLVERDVQSLVAETALLEAHGLGVQTAADADEAIETLSEESGCSLILLARLVSAPNTCDTIGAIRRQPEGKKVPLIVIGEAGDPIDEDRFRAAGANGFLRKPIDSAALGAVLAGHVEIGMAQRERQRA